MTTRPVAFVLLVVMAVTVTCRTAIGLPQRKDQPGAPAGGVQLPLLVWWGGEGRRLFLGDPDKPAILLFHGIHRDMRSWTAPGDDPGILRLDFRESPDRRDLGVRDYAGVGVFRIGVNKDQVDVNGSCWFDYLAARGFTVGAFDQREGLIERAVGSAQEALDRFVEVSATVNPGSPPPIALVGHSRGGLVIRWLLKGMPSAGRVKWVVTLSSPHQGSDLARAPELLGNAIRECIDRAFDGGPIPVPPEIPIATVKQKLGDEIIRALEPLFDYIRREELPEDSRELAPDSPMMASLAAGETAVPGISYYTFGGTDPNYMRIYSWWFTPESAVPQFRGPLPHYKWEIVPTELDPVSPMYAKVKDIVPEITPGKGDGLVADDRASLPWSTHHTFQLNHAEVLWNRPLQERVASILLGSGPLTSPAGDRLGGVLGREGSDWFGRLADEVQLAERLLAEASAPGGVLAGDGRSVPVNELRALLERLTKLDGQISGIKKAVERAAAQGGTPGASGVVGDKPLQVAPCCEVTPNPELKGRLGRVLVKFPEGSKTRDRDRAYLFRSGQTDAITFGDGGLTTDAMPGTYAISINSRRVEGVEVRAGHDTNVRVGVLRIVSASGTARLHLFEPGTKGAALTFTDGPCDFGLLPGTYEVQVHGQRELVTIKAGTITEF